MKKILVGMSGGVDSSAAALILLQKGYDVSGCTLKLCGGEGTADAENVCRKLGIKHYVFDLAELFAEKVIDSFAKGYINGGTPNPCIECNRCIKFGKMLEIAEENGFDGIATGHYANIGFDEKKGRYLLKKGADGKKDQSYFLYNMTQYQLEHTLFPLWDKSKAEIRALAEESGLANAQRPDSQDICFVGDGDYAGFIRQWTGLDFPPGDFIDTKGNKIGAHSGLINYTIGQRKGLGGTFGRPVFVCKKNAEDNTVTLGDSADLMRDTVEAENVNFISVPGIDGEMRVKAKIRYNMKEADGVLTAENGRIKVRFDLPVRAAAKGQSLVCYYEDAVVCGGIIV